jgi:hypothetical protein
VAAYRIKFMKKLADGPNQPETIYRSIIIRLARDSVRAVAAAKRRFERRECITHWRVHADRMKIEPLTYPDTSEFHTAPPDRQWRSFIEFRMNTMEKNLDPME